jgi:hypothetical protein
MGLRIIGRNRDPGPGATWQSKIQQIEETTLYWAQCTGEEPTSVFNRFLNRYESHRQSFLNQDILKLAEKVREDIRRGYVDKIPHARVIDVATLFKLL